MGRTQTLVQLSDELLERLDRRRERDGHASRSAVIRAAIETYLADDREAAIDAQIVSAYTRQPPRADGLADAAAAAMVADEPWDAVP